MIRTVHKNQFLIITLAVCFLLGIIYENFVGSICLFEMEQLLVLNEIDFEATEYLLYIIKMRGVQIASVFLLLSYRWKKMIVLVILWYCSSFLGRFLVSAVLTQGMLGIVISLAMLFPQVIFYMLICLIIVRQICVEERNRWKKIQIIVIVILFVLGVVCEVYINPRIIKMVTKWI